MSISISDEDDPKSSKRLKSDSEVVYRYKHLFGSHPVECNEKSLEKLKTDAYLTDDVLQIILAHTYHELCLSKDLIKSKVHLFDTYFYHQLQWIFQMKIQENGQKTKRVKGIDRERWQRLKKWYTYVDIFTKDFLVFPVCDNQHWYAIIVCFPSSVEYFDEPQNEKNTSHEPRADSLPASIIILDSLGLVKDDRTSVVRKFLDHEWRMTNENYKSFGHHSLPEFVPRVPKQKNNYDCGLYLLVYIESFMRGPRKFYKLVRGASLGDEDYANMLMKRIRELKAVTDRKKLYDLILKVCDKDNGSNLSIQQECYNVD